MKKILIFILILICPVIAKAVRIQGPRLNTLQVSSSSSAYVSINKGSNIIPYQVTCGSQGVVALWTGNANICDFEMYNPDGTYALHIGSYSAITTTTNSYPIQKEATHSPGGRFSGTIYAIYEAGASSQTVYIITFVEQ